MNREIIITCVNDRAFPSTAFAGYAGEHLATTLIWKLPEVLISAEYTYRVDFRTANNSYIAHIDSNLSFALPQALTIAGTLTVQLTISDKTEVVYKTNDVELNIKGSINATEDVEDKYVGLLDEKINDFQAVLERLGVLDVNELRGIARVEKTATVGYTDTYTIYYSDETTSTFTITNGADGKNASADKKFELIETITIDNDNVTVVERTQETDGAQYSFEEVLINIETEVASTNATFIFRVNNVSSVGVGDAIGTAKKYFTVHYKVHRGILYTITQNPVENKAWASALKTKNTEVIFIETINSIKISCSTPIPLGSKIAIYAARK